jgi:hypothetical protein
MHDEEWTDEPRFTFFVVSSPFLPTCLKDLKMPRKNKNGKKKRKEEEEDREEEEVIFIQDEPNQSPAVDHCSPSPRISFSTPE